MLAALQIGAALAVGAAVLVLLMGQLGLFSGKQPDNLGLRDGKLKPPSKTPNSVSSQAHHWPDRLVDYTRIEPFATQGDGPATMARIKAEAETMAGARIVDSGPDYLRIEFSTKLMRYVDDAEFWFSPAEQVVHVRSASRVGSSDFGVNRARIEALRARLTQNR